MVIQYTFCVAQWEEVLAMEALWEGGELTHVHPLGGMYTHTHTQIETEKKSVQLVPLAFSC